MRYQRAELPLQLNGLAAAREFFAGCIADGDPNRESLWVAHVDEQARCLHVSRHVGDESGADFPLKAIIADAARRHSAGILLAHNHPSGDPRPSDSDCRSTRRLAVAAEALDCSVIDHLIFAGRECSSLRRMGYL
ncbi:MAG: JAB domain-containing protein [Sphingomicrobium sp.]